MLRGAGLLVNLGEGIGGVLEVAMQEPASFHAAPSTMAPHQTLDQIIRLRQPTVSRAHESHLLAHTAPTVIHSDFGD